MADQKSPFEAPIFFPVEDFKNFVEPVNQEKINLVAPTAEYLVLDIVNTKIDDVYMEALRRERFKAKVPIQILVIIEDPSITEGTERGLQEERTARFIVPRKTLEESGIGAPKEGDLVRVWHPERPGFTDWVVRNTRPIDYFGDTGEFANFELEMIRREYLTPESLKDRVPIE